MEFAYFIAAVIIILLIYHKLNRKIDKLERQIEDLKSKSHSQIPTAENLSQESLQELNTASAEDQFEAFLNSAQDQETNPKEETEVPVFISFIRQNILTIAGIVTLVLGLGYFVKYAIDRNWINEYLRCAIGYLTGIFLISAGIYLRKKYSAFSAIVSGGGFSVLYFTTTIIFREYHLLSQNSAFAVTICITIFATVLSYRLKNEILIIFALLGGFAAPLMISTGQSNYLFLFGYISLLNLGVLAIAFFQNWKSIGWLAFICTTIYLFAWSIEKPQTLSVIFYVLSYLIFYAFALRNYIRQKPIQTSDIFLLILTNFALISGVVFTLKSQTKIPPSVPVFLFAVFNAAGLYRERQKKSDLQFSVFAGLVISLFTLAIALQLKTYLIATVWAIECSLILYFFIKTNQKIFRIAFYVLFALVMCAQYATWLTYIDVKNMEVIINRVFLTSLVILGCSIYSAYLVKKPTLNRGIFGVTAQVVPMVLCYFTVLFEIIYQLSAVQSDFLLLFVTLFSVYYFTVLLSLKIRLLNSKIFSKSSVYIYFGFLILHVISSQISFSVVKGIIPGFWYLIYLGYVPSVFFVFLKILPEKPHFKTETFKIIASSVLTVIFTAEAYHLFLLYISPELSAIKQTQNQFITFVLPILWMILSCVFLYSGIKKNAVYSKFGFILITITIVKLYLYDVWQMDHVSRIVAFIVLGLILLVSSFAFQRLKNLLGKFVEKNSDQNISDS